MDNNFNTNNMEGINLDKLDPRVSVSGEKKNNYFICLFKLKNKFLILLFLLTNNINY